MAEEQQQPKQAEQQTSSKEEQIGFHKGALATLAKEREEMMRILNVVEQLMQMHVESLKKQGVDLEKIAQQTQQKQGGDASQGQQKQAATPKKPKVPLEDAL
jgi:hypothetical protein